MNEMIPFEVAIRDCNESQELEWLVALNHSPDLGQSRVIYRAARITSAQRNPFQFTVESIDLTPDACNKVELRVSAAFLGIQVGEPVSEGDLGSAVWYLEVVSDPSTIVSLGGCP